MLTVLVLMFIWAAMVTGLLLWLRFIAEVMGAEMVTGVAEAELQTSFPSGGEKTRSERVFKCCSAVIQKSCSLIRDKKVK